jgi:Tfp pilus assembly protein PilO
MNRLSNQKRNQLVLTALAIAAILAGLWFTAIRQQQNSLKRLNADIDTANAKLAQIRDTIKNSTQIEAELIVVSNKLVLQEEDMAAGDLYSSMVNSIRAFKQAYNVDIPQYNNPGGGAVDVNLLPHFPYKQVTVSISGTARFHDLGRFIADFENLFPTRRILNLEIVPASATTAEETGNLSFKIDIVSLVKPVGATTPGKP